MTTWLDDLHYEQGMTDGAKEIFRRMTDGLDKQEDLIGGHHGGSDDGWVVESTRFDKVAQRQRGAMADLQMENEKLRVQNDRLLPKVRRQASELTSLRLALERRNGDLRAYKAQCSRLARENHELRELAKAYWWCTENYGLFDKCDSGCPLRQSSKLECECEVIMRRLGIEVGDA